MSAGIRGVIAWQKAIEMCLAVYAATASFPPSEKFGLTMQIRRASVSVASNIAEGYGRATTGEYAQFLGMARGSNLEVETQLVIATELRFGARPDLAKAERLNKEVGQLIQAILRSLH